MDTLADEHGSLPLPQGSLLVLAQPRALSPAENLALDAWVREGGRLLLFVDPMLTADSAFAIGDPRRPEAMAMLSPILRHWDLELEFDETQPAGEQIVTLFDTPLPVDLPGRFRAPMPENCRSGGDGIAVDCALGKGRVIAVADAAVFDGDDAGRRRALTALMAQISR